MKLEDQVCSLELSKRLKELRINQESFFWYTCFTDGTEDIYFQYNRKPFNSTHYSAFTATELGEMLPYHLKEKVAEIGFFKEKDFYEVSYIQWANYEIHEKIISKVDTNLANAMAKMLTHLIENNLLKE